MNFKISWVEFLKKQNYSFKINGICYLDREFDKATDLPKFGFIFENKQFFNVDYNWGF